MHAASEAYLRYATHYITVVFKLALYIRHSIQMDT